MSVDETASPRDIKDAHLSSGSLGEDDVATAKEAFTTAQEAMRERNHMTPLMAGAERGGLNRFVQQQAVAPPRGDSVASPPRSPAKEHIKRAHSLSPKSSRRIHHAPPPGVTYAGGSSESPAGKAIEVDHQEKGKPVRSALRGSKSSRGELHVTISPHSSEESFSSSNNSLSKVAAGQTVNTPVERRSGGGGGGKEGPSERRISQTERPKSMEALESHKFSQHAFPGDLHSGLDRHGSTRSDQLDYSEVAAFLKSGRLQELAQVRRGQDKSDSTPEVSICVGLLDVHVCA